MPTAANDDGNAEAGGNVPAQRIVVLGWGSLLWDQHPDFDACHGDWHHDGPVLRLEFSRISSTREGALTLVIDPDHGSPVTVAWTLSTRVAVSDAVDDLKRREGCPRDRIGCLDLHTPIPERPTLPGVAGIAEWGLERPLDAVVWTALEGNFEALKSGPFSVGAAIAHVQALPPGAKEGAMEYIRRASHLRADAASIRRLSGAPVVLLRHSAVGSFRPMPDTEDFKFDRIGYWSEVKLEIIAKYASAYSTILASQGKFHHVYIDGFAGAGEHFSRKTNEIVAGSPGRALAVQPRFREFFFIDLVGDKVENLRQLYGNRPDVHIQHGDCNRVLLEDVFPKVRWEGFRRGLCLLDPYRLNLNWEVIRAAGELRTIDLFLNFPIMDANRNVLWRHPERVSAAHARRMTAYWGGESWRGDIYHTAPQRMLFDMPDELEKADNDAVAEAFRRRLRDVAGFANVPKPLPMRNSNGAIVYYLFFASQKDVANNIVESIFAKYAGGRP